MHKSSLLTKNTLNYISLFLLKSELKCGKTELHKYWKVKNSLIVFYSWYHYHDLQGNIPDVMKKKRKTKLQQIEDLRNVHLIDTTLH